MLRYREHHIRDGYGSVKPIFELNNVPLLDERFIFDRNEIIDHERELDAVTPLRFGDMLYIVRNSPTGAERDDDIAALHELPETAPRDCHVDEIATRRLENRKEKSRIADDH